MKAALSLKGVKASRRADQGLARVTISKAELATSKNGNAMVQFVVLSDDVPYPLNSYQPFHNEKSLQHLRKLVEDVSASNPDKLTTEDIDSEDFNVKKLEGLSIGAYLRWNDESHRFLEVAYFVPVKDVQ